MLRMLWQILHARKSKRGKKNEYNISGVRFFLILTKGRTDAGPARCLGPVAPRTAAAVAASDVLTDLVVPALVRAVSALVYVCSTEVHPVCRTVLY